MYVGAIAEGDFGQCSSPVVFREVTPLSVDPIFDAVCPWGSLVSIVSGILWELLWSYSSFHAAGPLNTSENQDGGSAFNGRCTQHCIFWQIRRHSMSSNFLHSTHVVGKITLQTFNYARCWWVKKKHIYSLNFFLDSHHSSGHEEDLIPIQADGWEAGSSDRHFREGAEYAVGGHKFCCFDVHATFGEEPRINSSSWPSDQK